MPFWLKHFAQTIVTSSRWLASSPRYAVVEWLEEKKGGPVGSAEAADALVGHSHSMNPAIL